MAKPIEHSTVNTVATTGLKAGLWAGAIGLAALALPVVLGLGTVAAVWAIGFGSVGAIAGSAAVIAIGGLATLASTAVAGAASWAAGIGGIIGGVRSFLGIKAENQAYQARVDNLNQSRMQARDASISNAGTAGIQQGYGMGFQEGQASVVNQLRAAQEQMMMQQMVAAKGGKGFAAKETEKREAQAVGGPQVAC